MSTGLYVHLPFCAVRCTYCPFAISTDLRHEQTYFQALRKEVDLRVQPAIQLDTIYLGGGTPSRSSPAEIERLFSAIAARGQWSAETEVTIEANPEDINPAFLAFAERLGINRLSVGIQSTNDAELIPLGRRHGRDGALAALQLAASSGMRVSADLIIGLPAQTEESFVRSIDEVIDSGVGHISIYMLDLEEGTTLKQRVDLGVMTIPEDEAVAALYLEAIRRVEERGMRQYEISNFAKSGEESRHNLRYWRRVPYVGLGLGAHSFDGERRFANARDISAYIDGLEQRGSALDFEETLGPDEVTRETLFLSLRQRAGMHYAQLIELKGEEGAEWTERGTTEGWLAISEGRVAFTPAGFLLSNEYLSQLF